MVSIDTRWQDALVAQNACSEAMDFAARHETFQAAWDACERGDWMLWWIGRDARSSMLEKCAEIVRHEYPHPPIMNHGR